MSSSPRIMLNCQQNCGIVTCTILLTLCAACADGTIIARGDLTLLGNGTMPFLGLDISPIYVQMENLNQGILRVKVGAAGRWEVPQDKLFTNTVTGVPACMHAAAARHISASCFVELPSPLSYVFPSVAAMICPVMAAHAGCLSFTAESKSPSVMCTQVILVALLSLMSSTAHPHLALQLFVPMATGQCRCLIPLVPAWSSR